MSPPSVLLLNTKLGNVNCYLTEAVREGFAAEVGADRVRLTDYHRCIDDARAFRPDVLVCFDGQEPHCGMLAKLAPLVPVSVLWLTEDPYERERNTALLDVFDLVFTSDRGSVAAYESPKVRHLPLAASPTLHVRTPLEDPRELLYDVFFAGVAWPNRVRLLRKLRARLPDLRVRTLLPHNEALRPASIGVPPFEVEVRLSNPDLTTLHNRSRIVLHLGREFSAGGGASMGTTPAPRLFEVAAAGTAQLVPAQMSEVQDYFTPDQEVATFASLDECVEQIRRLTSSPEQRARLAWAAQRRARGEHLYEHRARRILDEVRALGPQRAPAVSTGPATVLLVAHNTAGVQPYGGTELFLRALWEHLSQRYRGCAYYPDISVPGATRMLFARRVADRDVVRVIPLSSPIDPTAVGDTERELAFARLLESEGVTVVHFVHLIHHPPSLIEVARRHGARVVVTMPDFFAVCPRFTLLDADERFCWREVPPLQACDIDLFRTNRHAHGSQARRRAAFGRLLGLASAITCLSESERRIVLGAYPQLEALVEVVEWGVDAAPFEARPRISGAGVLRVLVFGNFTKPKGADLLLHVFDYFRGDPRVGFDVVGRVDPPYDEILRTLNFPNVEVFAQPTRADLVDRFARSDAAIFASIWPETYVMALSETWAAGVVPIVADLGALGARVAHEVNGLVVPPSSSGHLASAIERLLEEPGLLERLRSAAPRVRTYAQATQAHERVYERVLAQAPRLDATLPPAQLRSLTALPSRFARSFHRWAWPQHAPPDVPAAALRRRTSSGPLATEPPPGPPRAACAARTLIDPPELDDDPVFDGASAGVALYVVRGKVRAVRVFGDGQPFGPWTSQDCREEPEGSLDDWMQGSSEDPRLVSPVLGLGWDDFDGVVVTLAASAHVETAAAQLFWTSARDDGFSEERSFRFLVHCDGKLRRHVLRPERRGLPSGFQRIERLRLDPLDVRGTFRIESIVLFADLPRLDPSSIGVPKDALQEVAP